MPVMFRTVRRWFPELPAEDLVQDGLLRAWQKRSTFDGNRGEATAWLVAIVMDRCRQARRTHAARLRVVASQLPAAPTGSSRDLDIRDAVGRLPTRQRLAVESVYFIGLTTTEAAQVLGCSAGTIKSNLFDARATLRRMLLEDPHDAPR